MVRHRYSGIGSFEGRAFADEHWCAMIRERREGLEGGWRLVMEQCSLPAASRGAGGHVSVVALHFPVDHARPARRNA